MRSNNKVVRVLEVLNARATARQAYQVVLARPTELEVAKNVVCLLLWLETIMGVQALDSVAAMAPANDASLTLLVTEASALSTATRCRRLSRASPPSWPSAAWAGWSTSGSSSSIRTWSLGASP